jgi:hypothetical protein
MFEGGKKLASSPTFSSYYGHGIAGMWRGALEGDSKSGFLEYLQVHASNKIKGHSSIDKSVSSRPSIVVYIT